MLANEQARGYMDGLETEGPLIPDVHFQSN
jgi:hypothetical protein